MAADDGTDDDLGEEPLDSLYVGVVVNNADPERLGRVQVAIAGMDFPASAWARMGGRAGGGGPARGMFMVPKLGSRVDVFFTNGDVDSPVYFPMSQARGEQLSHVLSPPRGGAVSPDQMELMWGWEGDRFAIQVDERPGNEYLRIVDKTQPDDMAIELDAKENTTTIAGSRLVHIKSKTCVAIEALRLTLNGRRVKVRGGDI